ncbi:hypothetical protein ABZX30_37950, partial [Streptomyces sp. NPDC004542]
ALDTVSEVFSVTGTYDLIAMVRSGSGPPAVPEERWVSSQRIRGAADQRISESADQRVSGSAVPA